MTRDTKLSEPGDALAPRIQIQTRCESAALACCQAKLFPDGSSQALWGILVPKQRLGLSRRGGLTALAAILMAGLSALPGIHPLLEVTHRTDARILLVEGWLHPFDIDAAVKEFKNGHYERVFTDGGPKEGSVRAD